MIIKFYFYFSEAAEEQYRIHSSQVPNLQNQQPNIQLGSGNRHFDPSKSETLRAIQEDEYNQQFGNGSRYVVTQQYSSQQYPSSQQYQTNQQYPSSGQQYVQSTQYYNEVPQQQQQYQTSQQYPSNQQYQTNQQYPSSGQQQYVQSTQYYNEVPQQQQQRQVWSGDAYERSERARSQTPNYRYYNQDNVRIPSSGPPQFTTDTPTTLVHSQIRYNSLPRSKRDDTYHK